jgi:DNA-directed RNA polymerase subunit M/transcription elongation factor TFIIS
MSGAEGLPVITTCTQCGDHQSGDPSGRCFDCRTAEPGYLARLNARVREFMAREPHAHKAAVAKVGDPGAFRFFWADVVRRACPECQLPTATGFDRHDPGAETREAARCPDCSAERIEWTALQQSRALGYPLTEQGPCASCREPAHRYGDGGKPLCATCEPEATEPHVPEPGPAPERAPEVTQITAPEVETAP